MSASSAIEQPRIFTPSEIDLIDLDKVPRHVAIIMDGNRRWAKKKGLPPAMGHWEGVEGLTEIVRAAAELGIKTLTVYAFSTENWRRTESEIRELMDLFRICLLEKRDLMVQEGICLQAIGDLDNLPSDVLQALQATQTATSENTKINLVLALNYGGRDELRRAVRKILQEHEEKKMDPEELTEEMIAKHLDTSPWGDPELLIRTSGECRVSNFLLWQIAYTEIYVTDVLWPEFQPKELFRAIFAYQSRMRRLGV